MIRANVYWVFLATWNTSKQPQHFEPQGSETLEAKEAKLPSLERTFLIFCCGFGWRLCSDLFWANGRGGFGSQTAADPLWGRPKILAKQTVCTAQHLTKCSPCKHFRALSMSALQREASWPRKRFWMTSGSLPHKLGVEVKKGETFRCRGILVSCFSFMWGYCRRDHLRAGMWNTATSQNNCGSHATNAPPSCMQSSQMNFWACNRQQTILQISADELVSRNARSCYLTPLKGRNF